MEISIRQPQGLNFNIGGNLPPSEKQPYLSLERLGAYLYQITFDTIPDIDTEESFAPSGCSSYVENGKLYRNLDWNYSETATFRVITKNFEGIAFMDELKDGFFTTGKLSQLPHRMTDGVNRNGIMVSTHVLFNDWEYEGCGDKNIPLTEIPYLVLSNVSSMSTINSQLSSVIRNIKVNDGLSAIGYLLQFLITDGYTTYVLMPPEDSTGDYILQDITDNPKLANFRWVSDSTVTREELQLRPTGVERWNMMPCPLSELAFTKAYQQPDRLSEFIGERETTKYSTDDELEEIYTIAHYQYLDRVRDGQTWQTMHSVIYSSKGMESLHVQEDFSKDYICTSSTYEAGNGIIIDNNVISVDTIDEVTGSLKPVTSSAVNVVVGNINAILTTI